MTEENETFQQLLRYLKALADESRLRLIGLLAQRERRVEELAALLDLRAPTVSHHLALLKSLDLVSMRADGNAHLYRLNDDGLRRMNALLTAPEQVVAPPFSVEADDTWERKVLRDFFEGDRLKEIPASRKKREVIMRWLAQRFEAERMYSEAEVNEVIKRYHPDAATLRRELLAFHLMQREGSKWRRIEETQTGQE